MTAWIIDNSIWAREVTDAAAQRRVDELLADPWALVNRAAVLTADRDFELIARAVPELLHEYVAPA